MTTRTWITATPPTPNGDLHVGHLAGPYVAADVLGRFLRADSHDVRLTTGLDDHQGYVEVRALKGGDRKPEETADRYGESIVRVWRDAAVEFDDVLRPRADPGYTLFVQDFFQRLYDEGHIVERTRPLPYCTPCARWLYEGHVTGGCPHCGASSSGNSCEPCGRPNDCSDLTDPHCATCREKAELRDVTRLYFPLAPFADQLAAFWQRVDMPPHLRALCERMLTDGLPEIAVSHPAGWGIPVPVAGFTDQRVFVWFEMAPGYLREYDPAGETLPQSGPVQFFGFDNGYFHAVLFPALFLAYDARTPLPRAFIVNEFYQLEGLKFSTSRRHAVWAHEALALVGSDVLRHHVLADRPNGRETSFSLPALERTRNHLASLWDDWLAHLFTAVEEDCAGRVPREEPTGQSWERLTQRLGRIAGELREAYSVSGFDPRRAVALLDEAVACASDFGHVHAHERDRPAGDSSYRAALRGQLGVAAALTAWSAPVMPRGAARLAAAVGFPAHRPVDASALCLPEPGASITAPTAPVFTGALHG
ncbi:class I tRNA ligase family protein [Streptomyces iakyrus]|uniref:methionine--tRNA ligase n=1 Tax=Streptomyces iakyrus TaxID=68219 RepID=UPI0005250673|nr:class I tRNA ligase family protein [Streptomyces iakyrus]